MGELSRARMAVYEAFTSGPGRDFDDRTTKALDDLETVARKYALEYVAELIEEHKAVAEGSACAVLTLAHLERDILRGMPQ